MPPETVKVAMGIPAPSTELEQGISDRYVAIDLDLGTQALDKFRESIANSVFYERGWFRSGMPALTAWLAHSASTASSEIKPAVRDLINSLLSDADESIKIEDGQRLQELLDSSIPEPTKSAILSSLALWAEHAHTELRDQLDVAFASKHWRKIAWWKLFWRVDDVGMIASDVLERRWLTSAEKDIIWVAGRIEEAGFFASDPDAASLPERAMLLPRPTTTHKVGDVPDAPRPSDLRKYANRLNDDDSTAVAPKPWPQQITLVRQYLSASTIPPLEALAQRLILETASTVSATSSLSALLWLSSSAGVFESGTVAALGAAWALRRMQGVWERARATWEAEVREEGRRALKETEECVREVVRVRGEAVGRDEVGVEERRRAREAVGRARGLLEGMGR